MNPSLGLVSGIPASNAPAGRRENKTALVLWDGLAGAPLFGGDAALGQGCGVEYFLEFLL